MTEVKDQMSGVGCPVVSGIHPLKVTARIRHSPADEIRRLSRSVRINIAAAKGRSVEYGAGSPNPAVSPNEAGSGDPALQQRIGPLAELRVRIAPTA